MNDEVQSWLLYLVIILSVSLVAHALRRRFWLVCVGVSAACSLLNLVWLVA
jgi:hypothetical protein